MDELRIIRAGNTEYLSLDSLAQEMGLAKQTIRIRVNEIRAEIGKRYKSLAVIDDGNIVLVNRFVFIDYMANRRKLRDKNLRKHVEPFNAAEVASYLGFYEVIEVENTKKSIEDIKEDKKMAAC